MAFLWITRTSRVNRTKQSLKKSIEDFSEDFWKTFRNSQKTLGRLPKKSSNVFYARRLPTKSSRSLPKSYAQSGYKGMMSSGTSCDNENTSGKLSEDFFRSFP
ncbi:hypothetical protein YC2023_081311 [Brassica napus]